MYKNIARTHTIADQNIQVWWADRWWRSVCDYVSACLYWDTNVIHVLNCTKTAITCPKIPELHTCSGDIFWYIKYCWSSWPYTLYDTHQQNGFLFAEFCFCWKGLNIVIFTVVNINSLIAVTSLLKWCIPQKA